jgi:acyl-CoA thioesterase FadM
MGEPQQAKISYRGAVPPWECDTVDHFTVAYYYEKLDLATAAVLIAAGIDPMDRAAPCMTQCLTQYNRELRKGDIYHIESVRLADAKLGHRLIDSATGEVCTHFEQSLSASVPDFAGAGGDWDGPEQVKADVVGDGPHWQDTATDIVVGADCGLNGDLSAKAVIHRFSTGNEHLRASFGMTPAYAVSANVGFSTFGFDLVVSGTAKPGMGLTTQSCISHVGRSSLKVVHRLIRDHDATEICRLSQAGVQLDLNERRPLRFPDEMADAARQMLPAG